jgi:hypothetical protein
MTLANGYQHLIEHLTDNRRLRIASDDHNFRTAVHDAHSGLILNALAQFAIPSEKLNRFVLAM